MSERTVREWVCDDCGRHVRRGVMPPGGWHEASNAYGFTAHCCDDPRCHMWMRAFCRENGFQLPFGLKQQVEVAND